MKLSLVLFALVPLLAGIFHTFLLRCDYAPLVAQVSNLPYRRLPVGRASGTVEASAGWKPAIQQIGNLRYPFGRRPPDEIFEPGWAGVAADSPGPAGAAPLAGKGFERRAFKDCLLPAVRRGGFQMDGFILWCSSVIKVGDTYHLFASRWPAQYELGGWTKYSECVRATSTNLLGPYTFQEVVLQKRTNNWDNTRIHNVKVVRAAGKFVLYYIDSANETGFADADAVTGPWRRRDKVAMRVSNPAVLVKPDSSVYVFGRLRDAAGVNRGIAFTAASFDGPYSLVASGDNLLPDGCELEDPAIWWANGQYNVLLNDWKGKATGVSKAGAQYCSRDGIHYTLMGRTPVFTKTVVYDDGSAETFSRRERPFVYVNDKQEAIALFTACLPPTGPARIVAQPVDRYYPGNTPSQHD